MKRGYTIAIVATIAASVLFFGLLMALFIGSGEKGFFDEIEGKPTSVALIRIEGVIAGTGDEMSFTGGSGIVSPERVIDELHQALDDPDVASIMLRVNSPGGTAAASEEIYREVKRVGSKKPIVVSISDVGASGAYYISSAAGTIVASPASEVGSIGTIIEIPNLSGLFKKLGIELQVVAQGKYKDLGNPGRPITDEERKILSDQSRIVYDRFISDVAKGRKMKESEIRKFANGLTFPGVEAKKMGLVDVLGNFQDALLLAGKLGKIDGEPEIVEYGEDPFSELFSGVFGADLNAAKLLKQLGPGALTPVIK